MLSISAATVRHVSKNHVTMTPGKGYSITLFNIKGGTVEAFVSADDGGETIRLLVAGPQPGQMISIMTDRIGVVHVLYADAPDVS
jgi:hypothetical protein